MKAAIERVTKTGRREGIELTQRDIEFVKFTTRWWCVSPQHFVRFENAYNKWEDAYVYGEDETWRVSARRSVVRRTSRLGDLGSDSLLSVARGPGREPAIWATKQGGDLVGANFTHYLSGNISRALHAWIACDVGMQLERAGLRVYSEREFANGWTIRNKEVVGGKYINVKPGSRAPNDHCPRPDLAIGPDDQDDPYGRFIFVEVERDSGQGYSKYRKKLESYYSSERVAAVWYVVDSKAIGARIKRIHTEMQETQRDMPLRIFLLEELQHGYHRIAGKGPYGPKAQEDLALINASTDLVI